SKFQVVPSSSKPVESPRIERSSYTRSAGRADLRLRLNGGLLTAREVSIRRAFRRCRDRPWAPILKIEPTPEARRPNPYRAARQKIAITFPKKRRLIAGLSHLWDIFPVNAPIILTAFPGFVRGFPTHFAPFSFRQDCPPPSRQDIFCRFRQFV